MSKIENKLFNDLDALIKAQYADAETSSVYTDSPSTFPHISIVEQDNTTETRDISHNEVESAVMFQIDIYTINDKPKADAIRDIVNGYMLGKGFKRTYCHPTPNLDRKVYRITMRFKGIVSKGFESGSGTESSITYYVR